MEYDLLNGCLAAYIVGIKFPMRTSLGREYSEQLRIRAKMNHYLNNVTSYYLR